MQWSCFIRKHDHCIRQGRLLFGWYRCPVYIQRRLRIAIDKAGGNQPLSLALAIVYWVVDTKVDVFGGAFGKLDTGPIVASIRTVVITEQEIIEFDTNALACRNLVGTECVMTVSVGSGLYGCLVEIDKGPYRYARYTPLDGEGIGTHSVRVKIPENNPIHLGVTSSCADKNG